MLILHPQYLSIAPDSKDLVPVPEVKGTLMPMKIKGVGKKTEVVGSSCGLVACV